jgi:hypothetical protein
MPYESEGVRIESQRHGFQMVLARPDDESWADAVIEGEAHRAGSATEAIERRLTFVV